MPLSYNSCIIAGVTFASGFHVGASFTLGQVCWSTIASYWTFLFVLKIHRASSSLSEVRVRWEGRTEISNNPAAGNYFAGSGTNCSVSLGATVQHRIGPFHGAGRKDQRRIMGTAREGEKDVFWCNKLIFEKPIFTQRNFLEIHQQSRPKPRVTAKFSFFSPFLCENSSNFHGCESEHLHSCGMFFTFMNTNFTTFLEW